VDDVVGGAEDGGKDLVEGLDKVRDCAGDGHCSGWLVGWSGVSGLREKCRVDVRRVS
jgi:hypothetical protein